MTGIIRFDSYNLTLSSKPNLHKCHSQTHDALLSVIPPPEALRLSMIDDQIPPTEVGGGFSIVQAFVQSRYEVEPISAFDGHSTAYPGFSQSGGVTARWVDIAPNTDTPMHYTDTLDYLVITHGELELVLHDGSKKVVRPGDLVIQLANIHQWNNKGDIPARFLGICLPSQPVVIDGKKLNEAPFNGYKLDSA